MSPSEAGALLGRIGGKATYGETKGTAKLTEPDVLYILTSSDPASFLAKQLNVSRRTVYSIRQRKGWKHVNP